METARVIQNDYLTNHDLMEMFRVGLPCIYKWRRYKGMPFLRISSYGNAPIRYDCVEICEWAKENNKKIKNPQPLERIASDK